MITAIEIENFKGIGKRQRIEFAPLTLLFGGNSAGKSTIAHAIHYAREVLVNHNCDVHFVSSTKDALDLGGFESVLHRQDKAETRQFSIQVEVNCNRKPNQTDLFSNNGRRLSEVAGTGNEPLLGKPSIAGVRLTVRQEEEWKPPYLSELTFTVDGQELAKLKSNDQEGRVKYLASLASDHPLFDKRDHSQSILTELMDKMGVKFGELDEGMEFAPYPIEGERDIVPTQNMHVQIFGFEYGDNPSEEEIRLGFIAHEFSIFVRQLLLDVTQEVTGVLDRFCHIGPLRDIPPRGLRQTALKHASWFRGMAAYNHLLNESEVFTGNALDLETLLDAPYRVERKGIWTSDELSWKQKQNDQTCRSHLELQLIDLRNKTPVDFSAVGSGVSQVIPVLVAARDQSLPVVFIEQPELHLHPRHQGNLADVFRSGFAGMFSNYVPQPKQDSPDEYDGRCCIVETHSEHLLLRLMRRIRESAKMKGGTRPLLSPSDVAVYYVENLEDGTVFQLMPMNDHGELVKAWPGGFFEEALEDMI